MKLRKDFLLAIFILFAIPVIGYFVLQRAADDRMKISARLQPKDSISLEVTVHYLSAEGKPKSDKLIDIPYIIKVMSTEEGLLQQDQLENILYIINDRQDLAFFLYERPLNSASKDRIIGYNPDKASVTLSSYGDILLVDAFNRILQTYDRTEPELYRKMLEDISYALPMVDFQIEKISDNEQQNTK